MLLMWILNKVAPKTIPLWDFKREMPKSQDPSLGKLRCAYQVAVKPMNSVPFNNIRLKVGKK